MWSGRQCVGGGVEWALAWCVHTRVGVCGR